MKKVVIMTMVWLLCVGVTLAQDTTRRGSRTGGRTGGDTMRTDTSRKNSGSMGTIKRDTTRRK